MKEKTKLMVLVILECRLSLKMSCKLFNTTEEELLKRFEEDNFANEHKTALAYLFNYETAIENEESDKRALFKAKCYIHKISKISSNPNLEERKKNYQELINYLMDKEIKDFLISPTSKCPKKWTEEQRKAILKLKLKNALSNRNVALYYQLKNHTISDWINALDDSEFKEKQIMLNEYYYDKYARDIKRKRRIRHE